MGVLSPPQWVPSPSSGTRSLWGPWAQGLGNWDMWVHYGHPGTWGSKYNRDTRNLKGL